MFLNVSVSLPCSPLSLISTIPSCRSLQVLLHQLIQDKVIYLFIPSSDFLPPSLSGSLSVSTLAPPSPSALPLSLLLPIVVPVVRGPVNKPFKPHLLCSLITHAIFIHGCHSRRHIKAAIPSLLSSSPPLSFLLSSPLSSFCLHPPFSPTSSLPSFPLTHSVSSSVAICVHRNSETVSVFSCDRPRRAAVVKTVYLFIDVLCAGSAH